MNEYSREELIVLKEDMDRERVLTGDSLFDSLNIPPNYRDSFNLYDYLTNRSHTHFFVRDIRYYNASYGEVKDAMFVKTLEDMPLCVNIPVIEIIARWRLKIGR